jgi:hypothetical protein
VNLGAEGFEPVSVTPNHTNSLPKSGSEGAAYSGAFSTANPQIDPDLAKIIEAWRTLPEPIRRAMLALIGLG